MWNRVPSQRKLDRSTVCRAVLCSLFGPSLVSRSTCVLPADGSGTSSMFLVAVVGSQNTPSLPLAALPGSPAHLLLLVGELNLHVINRKWVYKFIIASMESPS